MLSAIATGAKERLTGQHGGEAVKGRCRFVASEPSRSDPVRAPEGLGKRLRRNGAVRVMGLCSANGARTGAAANAKGRLSVAIARRESDLSVRHWFNGHRIVWCGRVGTGMAFTVWFRIEMWFSALVNRRSVNDAPFDGARVRAWRHAIVAPIFSGVCCDR